LLVSVVVAIIVTPLSIVTYATVVTEEGEEVTDLRAIDRERLSQLSEREFCDYMASLPKRKVEGLARFTYPFTHPQIAEIYLRVIITWFIGLLAATVLVSFLNSRSRHRPNNVLNRTP